VFLHLATMKLFAEVDEAEAAGMIMVDQVGADATTAVAARRTAALLIVAQTRGPLTEVLGREAGAIMAGPHLTVSHRRDPIRLHPRTGMGDQEITTQAAEATATIAAHQGPRRLDIQAVRACRALTQQRRMVKDIRTVMIQGAVIQVMAMVDMEATEEVDTGVMEEAMRHPPQLTVGGGVVVALLHRMVRPRHGRAGEVRGIN